MQEEEFNIENSPLSAKVALFNQQADIHKKRQSINPFSSDQCVGAMSKPQFDKNEYGRPQKGSKSEMRALQATIEVCKGIVTCCEVINTNGEFLFSPSEKKNDPRKVISFGDLFTLYTVISDKLVGMLIRARKYGLIDFEGEVLYQRRDDSVPIILLKPVEEIRIILNKKIEDAEAAIRENEDNHDISVY